MTDKAQLSIELSTSGTSYVLHAADQDTDSLNGIALRFPVRKRLHANRFEVPLDAFLSKVGVLSGWPGSISWSANAKALTESILRDSARVAAQLEQSKTSAPPVPEPNAAKIELGTRWQPPQPLRDFQLQDLSKLVNLSHGANFSVPGAGKTRVSLALYEHEKSRGAVRRLLVVCPKSSYGSWTDEIALVYRKPLPKYEIFETNLLSDTEIALVNYERLSGSLGQLAEWLAEAPSMLVLDEAHRIKRGINGVYGSACLTLSPLAARRLILSGTPAPNGVEDLATLMSVVWPGYGAQAVANAVSNRSLNEASRLLKPLYVRTKKSDLALPERLDRLVFVDLPPLHKEVYRALVGFESRRVSASCQDMQELGKCLIYLLMAADCPALLAVGSSRYDPLNFRVPPLVPNPESDMEQLMVDLPSYEFSPKYLETVKIVDANFKLGRKTLVWSGFVRSILSLQKILSAFNPAVVHGGTLNRYEEIAKFRSDPSCGVLISNPATLGEGISLHKECNDAIYVDRDFSAGRFLQSVDRIHRLGLPDTANCSVNILVARGTIDEVVHARLARKLEFLGKILDDPDVTELAAPEEEPSLSESMDKEDLKLFMEHLGVAG
ncbi:MAG: DEAD/DEAH box helicase [Proteobacteria bacterium]|nr:DEAD/DEAH box helicase [Pseudomonadota bacterium]